MASSADGSSAEEEFLDLTIHDDANPVLPVPLALHCPDPPAHRGRYRPSSDRPGAEHRPILAVPQAAYPAAGDGGSDRRAVPEW